MSNIIPFQDVQGMAQAIAKSGLFGMKTPEQALALMLVAQAEGQHPATVTQDYDIIQGRAARKTHSVLARFQQMGGSVEWHELSDTVADASFSHKSGGTLRIQWTFDQAKRAGLTNKDNWRNYPRAMLRARCIAEGIRAVYPAALGGMMVSEEAQDLPAQEGAAPARPARNPQAAVNQQIPDGYEQFESEHLQAMRDAAMNGPEALQRAFAELPKGAHKTLFWQNHGKDLKAASEQATVIDVETGEVL